MSGEEDVVKVTPKNPEEPSVPVLSKKKQKRLKRYGGEEGMKEHWEKKKKEYKERVKERKKEEKVKQQEEWDGLPEEEKERRKKEAGEVWEKRKKAKQELEEKVEIACKNPGDRPQLVIDMDFENEMDGKDMKSLAQQVSLCHAHLRSAGLPCWLTLAGLKTTSGCHAVLSAKQNFENWKLTKTPDTVETHLPHDPEKTVYLTGDSPNVLEGLLPGVNYVIGGIVDRNQHKGITLKKATRIGFGHARFPLDTYLQSRKSDLCKTLTTNHVVEVLTHVTLNNDWDAAFDAVLPTRRTKPRSQRKGKDGETEGTSPNPKRRKDASADEKTD